MHGLFVNISGARIFSHNVKELFHRGRCGNLEALLLQHVKRSSAQGAELALFFLQSIAE
jgi:hypothetical protein